VDIEPFFEEVHRSNMAKVGGTRRPDGKWLKPPDWQPPDLTRILRERYGTSGG
jgi:predicted HAD superfamily Cof-like phosphohydrolase